VSVQPFFETPKTLGFLGLILRPALTIIIATSSSNPVIQEDAGEFPLKLPFRIGINT